MDCGIPTEDGAIWKCSHCENCITGTGVQRVYNAIQMEIDQLEMMEGAERLEATEKVGDRFSCNNVFVEHYLFCPGEGLRQRDISIVAKKIFYLRCDSELYKIETRRKKMVLSFKLTKLISLSTIYK